METLIFVFPDLWSTNIHYIYYICDSGWVWEETKPNGATWTVLGEFVNVYLVYSSSGERSVTITYRRRIIRYDQLIC